MTFSYAIIGILVIISLIIFVKIIKIYFKSREQKNNSEVHKTNFYSYCDSVHILKNYTNLDNISVHTTDLKLYYSELLNLIFKQKNLEALTIFTEYDPRINLKKSSNKFLKLKYLYLSIDKKSYPFDYLQSIIESSPYIETINYNGGLLNEQSMNILPNLRHLKTLILTDIKILNFEKFNMHFNLNIQKM